MAWCYLCDFNHEVLEEVSAHTSGKEVCCTCVHLLCFQYLVTTRECCHSNHAPQHPILHTTKCQIELTLEQHRRVTDTDPVHSGKSRYNKQCSPSYLWLCIHASSQLHIVDQVVL